MAELRIPREEERKQIDEYYECVGKGCIHAEALISVSYSMFRENLTPRIRCNKTNIFLSTESKICSGFKENEK